MADLASDIMDEARVLLNDQAAANYTNTVLLPVVKKVYREAQQKIGNVGGPVVKEQTATLTIPALTTKITFSSSPALPAALLYPIQLQEKVSGEDDSRYMDMHEREWVPTTTQDTRLRWWSWIDDEIRFLGATVPVPILIRYYGGLAELAAANSPILILDAKSFMAARTAAIAAFSIGGSLQRAQVLQQEADDSLETLLERIVKNRQGVPVRRKKFKAFRWRPFWRT